MPGSGKTFYIAGAGITGLTLALALARFGAKVIVLERNAGISEFGAGLQISPNARLQLDRLGLGDAIASQSLEPAGIDIYPFRRPAPLVTLELGAIMRQRFGSPYAVMHRADLAEVLFKATRRFANIEVLFGVRNWSAESHERGVTLTIEDAGGHTRTGRAHGLIGADGVHSQTRRTLLGGADAQFAGRTAWRALLPFDAVADHLALDRVSVLFAPGFHMVCYPLPHRRQVNIALFAKGQPAPNASAPNLPASARRSERLAALLDAGKGTWANWPLYTVTAPSWHTGNIALAGDAAHAMVPFQAQGAAMGIEDAAVLAPLLARHDTASAAFAQYERIRQPRVTRIARVSQSNGRIFHMNWPLGEARNLSIAAQGRQGHLKRLTWLYGHDAGLIPAASDAG